MKLKTLLLWWIFTLLWILNYSSAWSLTLTSNWSSYSPSSYTFSNLTTFDVDTYECNSMDCTLDLYSNSEYFCSISYVVEDTCNDCSEDDEDCLQNCSVDSHFENSCNEWQDWLPDWYITFHWQPSWLFDEIVFSFYWDGSSWGGDNWWGDNWWGDTWGSLIASWVAVFSPVINWLNDSFGEFLPYIVYIAFGVLGAVIWFVAIRWLINRLRAKVFGSFSSWRRK